MPDQVMTVHRVFLLEVAAAHRQETQEPLVLISIQRLATPPSAQSIGNGDSEVRLEQDLCTDQFVLDNQDSLRLMLGLAKVRAAQGCGISMALLDQYGAGDDGAEEAAGDQPPGDTPL